MTAVGSGRRPTDRCADSWPALGTTAVLQVTGSDCSAPRSAVEREIAAIDAAASRFREDSELSRLNAAAGARMAVSALFMEALRLALRAAELTDGAVDPTLGESLVTAGYDRDQGSLDPVPDGEASCDRAPRLVIVSRRTALWRMIELTEDPPTARLPRGVSLDLGATAKALASDRAARAAHEAGGQGVLVSLGGDIATAGPAPDGGWVVHVTDDHRSGPEAPGQTIRIHSGGLATSSVTVRRWCHEGRVKHHILDPRDGSPVSPIWRTVSVAAASCADANIASTAAIVLGERAATWLTERGLPARLVALDGTALAVGGWPT
ncbi:MAG: FAD:protein FMN transferase [Solirubrobacteraceae bacterium]